MYYTLPDGKKKNVDIFFETTRTRDTIVETAFLEFKNVLKNYALFALEQNPIFDPRFINSTALVTDSINIVAIDDLRTRVDMWADVTYTNRPMVLMEIQVEISKEDIRVERPLIAIKARELKITN